MIETDAFFLIECLDVLWPVAPAHRVAEADHHCVPEVSYA